MANNPDGKLAFPSSSCSWHFSHWIWFGTDASSNMQGDNHT